MVVLTLRAKQYVVMLFPISSFSSTYHVYVGMFYSPELDNNPMTDTAPGGIDDLLKHGVVAKYRNYSITTGGVEPPPTGSQFTGISVQGGNVVFTWSGTGTLQSADAVTGPYADVAGATSPRSVPVANGPKYVSLQTIRLGLFTKDRAFARSFFCRETFLKGLSFAKVSTAQSATTQAKAMISVSWIVIGYKFPTHSEVRRGF